jgi:hypothetical protein
MPAGARAHAHAVADVLIASVADPPGPSFEGGA